MSCEASPEVPEAPETFGTPSLPLYVEKLLASVDAEPVSEESVPFQRAEFFPFNAFASDAPQHNTAVVRLAFRSPENNAATFGNTKFVYQLWPDGTLVIEAPRGQKFDLSTLYLKGTVGDGVVVQYS